MTLDGTDCKIQEPRPFERKWFSHKFRGPGVRYEVGVNIQNGWIVWCNGPYPYGEWSDIKIARHTIVDLLQEDEMCVADGGYRDGYEHFETPTGLNNYDQRMKKLARARHETVNKRIKQFKVLSEQFRHPLEKHGICFRACANLTQLVIKYEAPLFQVVYYDRV